MENHAIVINGTRYPISTPDGFTAVAEAAFADQYGYQSEVDDPENPGTLILNPVSQQAFMASKIFEYVRGITAAYNLNVGAAAGRATAQQQNDGMKSQIVEGAPVVE